MCVVCRGTYILLRHVVYIVTLFHTTRQQRNIKIQSNDIHPPCHALIAFTGLEVVNKFSKKDEYLGSLSVSNEME